MQVSSSYAWQAAHGCAISAPRCLHTPSTQPSHLWAGPLLLFQEPRCAEGGQLQAQLLLRALKDFGI